MLGNLGAAMQGFGEAKMWRDKVNQRERELDILESFSKGERLRASSDQEAAKSRGQLGPTTPAVKERSIDGPAAQPSGGARLKIADPANTSLPPHARAFLNAISVGESGGAYNVRYTPNGGATFDETGLHPRIYEPTKSGDKSSAAGRYQFVASTWDDIAGPDVPFTRENQDFYAWELAKRNYNRDGRDLEAELQSGGLTPQILSHLGGTWAALKNESSLPKYIGAYNDSLSRYQTPQTPPAMSGQAGKAISRGIEATKSIAEQILDRIKG